MTTSQRWPRGVGSFWHGLRTTRSHLTNAGRLGVGPARLASRVAREQLLLDQKGEHGVGNLVGTLDEQGVTGVDDLDDSHSLAELPGERPPIARRCDHVRGSLNNED